MPQESENKNIALMLTAFFGIISTSLFLAAVFSWKSETAVPLASPVPMTGSAHFSDPFKNITITANAAIVFDTVTGEVLYEKNAEAQLPLASVTKVMTALVASEAPQDMRVSISNADLSDGAGGLALSEKWTLKNLINYTLVISSNSGANAIAGAVGGTIKKNENRETSATDEDFFVRRMNVKAQELGLHQTFYLNPSGLDVSVEGDLSGGYGSAKDMAKLFSYIIKNKPALLSMTAYDSLQLASADGSLHRADNTNLVARSIPGLIASKTGLTDLANGNLVVAFDVGPAHPVVVAVLGSTPDGRFLDVEKLVKASALRVNQE